MAIFYSHYYWPMCPSERLVPSTFHWHKMAFLMYNSNCTVLEEGWGGVRGKEFNLITCNLSNHSPYRFITPFGSATLRALVSIVSRLCLTGNNIYISSNEWLTAFLKMLFDFSVLHWSVLKCFTVSWFISSSFLSAVNQVYSFNCQPSHFVPTNSSVCVIIPAEVAVCSMFETKNINHFTRMNSMN